MSDFSRLLQEERDQATAALQANKPVKYGQIHHRGMWQIPYKATDVLCSDGRRRTAITAQEANMWFSLPAKIRAHGKTISGSITSIQTDGQPDLAFHAYTYRKNVHVLPDWIWSVIRGEWVTVQEGESELTRVTPDGRYALKIRTSGIGGPIVYVVDTQDQHKERATLWAKPETLDQAKIKATTLCTLLNTGCDRNESLRGWDSFAALVG